MADPVWGLLPKAQDDPQLITEAIDAAIAAHEADPEAHLGSGESLEQHRANVVIDHPAGSVLGDKFTKEEFIFTPTFESFDNWDKAGFTIQAEPGGLKLGTSNVNNAIAYMYAGANYIPISYQPNISTTLQAVIALSAITNVTAYFLAGSNEHVNDTPGVGFKFLNGSVFGVEAYHSGGAYHENTVLLGSFAAGAFHLYRVQVDSVTGIASFFIDGIKIHELTLHSDDEGGLALITYYIKTTSANFREMYTGSPYLSLIATP